MLVRTPGETLQGDDDADDHIADIELYANGIEVDYPAVITERAMHSASYAGGLTVAAAQRPDTTLYTQVYQGPEYFLG